MLWLRWHRLVRLEKLDLGFNGLTTVSPLIGRLHRLVELRLNDNSLASLPEHLDTGVAQGPAFPALRLLHLQFNSLRVLPRWAADAPIFHHTIASIAAS